VIENPGYLHINLSHDATENIDVYFDDLRIEHTHSDIVAGADYYPFGLPMAEREITREPYRHGYQGQFAEKDGETGWNAFELRMYDARVARWLSTDPEGQFFSPYAAMGNNPVTGTDPDGGWVPDLSFMYTKGWSSFIANMLGGDRLFLTGSALAGDLGKAAGPAAISKAAPTLSKSFEQVMANYRPAPTATVSAWNPGLIARWSASGNILAKASYEIADAAFVTSRFFMPWRDPVHLNGAALQGWDKSNAFATTAATFLPVGPKGNVTANRAAGLAFEEELAAALTLAGREVRRGVVKWTPFGRRVIDIEVRLDGQLLGGVECKLGNSRYHLAQRVKDWWLRTHRQYIVNVARKPR
jgi:RHS repeat-associated protein